MRSCQSWSKLPYGAGVRTTFKMPVLWLLKVSLLLLLQELYEWMTVKGRIEFLWHDEMFSPKHSDCVVWARVEHSSNIDNVFSSCFDTSQTESTDQTHLQISQLHCIAMLQLICHQYNAKYCLFFPVELFITTMSYLLIWYLQSWRSVRHRVMLMSNKNRKMLK